jgi:hypothetical protein
MPTNAPSYGTPNYAMLKGWLELAPDADQPFWAVNLMKYRTIADYGDGSETRTGKEADDAYTPLETLAAIGAQPVFFGDVIAQPLGTPAWDRIGIVRYPTHRSFLEMQRRDDFQKQHVHKEAGMDFTIVMACRADAIAAPQPPGTRVAMTVERGNRHSAATIANLTVEGVIIGDERTFDIVRFDRATDDAAVDAIVAAAKQADDAHVVVVEPRIDVLAESLA